MGTDQQRCGWSHDLHRHTQHQHATHSLLGAAQPAATRWEPTAARSAHALGLRPRLPAAAQRAPNSPPPRTCRCTAHR
jgi:hypothetical protein